LGKKSGRDGLSSCPYCEEFLEFVEMVADSSRILEIYKCPACGRKFLVRFTAEEWTEI